MTFGAYGVTRILFCMRLSTNLSAIMGIHVHFDYVCVCASMCGLGVCIWVCASHALRLQHLNVGVDTYAWLRYAVSVDRVIPLAQRRSARPLSWFFACAMSITVPNSEQAAAAVLYSWVGDPMHARILFFSVYWVWYYTYVVHHYLFIVVCVLFLTMPCRVELCNCNLFCPFFATIQRKLLDQSIWRKQWLYLTFQYMPTYVLRVCLYVSLITLDRLVLCIPSVQCFCGLLPLRRLCTDRHLPVCGRVKHRIPIL